MNEQETIKRPEGAVPSTSESLSESKSSDTYRVWASDNQVYGPVPLSTLLAWAKDARVFPETWIYSDTLKSWREAGTVPELKDHVYNSGYTSFLLRQGATEGPIDPRELRQFPGLAPLSSTALADFIKVSQLLIAQPGEVIIKRNEPGESIFFVLSGAVRVRIIVGYDEKVLARIPAGQFLGELSMFTHTDRTADVVAEEITRLLRVSAEAFSNLIENNPAAAAPLLHHITSTLAHRILDTNKHLQMEVAGGFVWR